MKGLLSKIKLPFNQSEKIQHLRITFPLIPKKVETCLKAFTSFSPQKNKAIFISLNGIEDNPEHSQLLHDAIKHTNDDKRIPVFAFLEDRITALSYFIASPSHHIAANPFCLMGDLTTPHKSYTNVKKLFQYFGANFQMLGKEQPTIWQSWHEPSSQQKDLTKRWLELVHKNLKVCLRQKRKVSDQNIQQFGSKLISPKQALQLKLIDSIRTVTELNQTNFPNFKLNQQEISVKPRNHRLSQSQLEVLQEIKSLLTMPKTVMLTLDDPVNDCLQKLIEVVSLRISDPTKLEEFDQILGKLFNLCQTQFQNAEILI